MKPKTPWQKMKEQNAARARSIRELYENGVRLGEIGKRHGISRQRVWQILEQGRR